MTRSIQRFGAWRKADFSETNDDGSAEVHPKRETSFNLKDRMPGLGAYASTEERRQVRRTLRAPNFPPGDGG